MDFKNEKWLFFDLAWWLGMATASIGRQTQTNRDSGWRSGQWMRDSKKTVRLPTVEVKLTWHQDHCCSLRPVTDWHNHLDDGWADGCVTISVLLVRHSILKLGSKGMGRVLKTTGPVCERWHFKVSRAASHWRLGTMPPWHVGQTAVEEVWLATIERIVKWRLRAIFRHINCVRHVASQNLSSCRQINHHVRPRDSGKSPEGIHTA